MTPLTQRRLAIFRANRRGWYSFWLTLVLVVLSLGAELIANDQPLLISYGGELYSPILHAYPETTFGGFLETNTDYRDPFIRAEIEADGWIVWPPIPYSWDTVVHDLPSPAPSPPTWQNWLGTDDQARDVSARLIYGFRISILFGLILTFASSIIGITAGAVQGYFGGWIDLIFQRFIEIWSGMPTLYLLIILASVVTPTFGWLLGLMLLFSWMTLVGVVRAEVLRTRNFDYVRAARALGMSHARILRRHVLPNAMVATLTFLPFVTSGAVVTLTSLDFLGFGMPPGSASLGELLRQGKDNLQAPWLGFSGFLSIATILTLLVFIGEAVRDAFDPRRAAADASNDRPTIGAEVSVAAPVADPILQVENLQVRFATPMGNTDALGGVSFGIARGEVLALVGESGSGKSVSALSILGLLPDNATHPAGRIRFQDEDLLGADEARLEHLRGNRISMIFQEPMTSLNPLHTIHKQVQEAILIHRPIRLQDARAESESLLASVGLEMKKERGDPYPHELSGGQRQRVMIAIALANGPDLLIADEPTTAVDVTIQAQLLELLADLREKRGMAMLFITHDLGIVRRIADRVCVMQAGRIVESGATTEVLKNPQHDYTRHLLAAEPRGRPAPVSSNAPTIAETESLKVWFPIRRGIFGRTKDYVHAVDGVSLTIREGETLGIVGESGSGKSTLGQAWLHLIPSQGSIRFATNSAEAGDPLGRTAPEGSDGSAGSPSVERTAPQQRDSSTGSLREQDDGSAGNAREQRRALRRMAQIVFQDPYGSLSPRLSVAQIIGEGLDVHGLAASAEERERRVIEALEEVELDPAIRHRYPHEFSGGQRQRIAIARAMILRPRLVILDEPTSALDVSVQAQVTDLLKDLQRRHGTSYLFISHDLRVIRAMSHRVAVMKDGKIIEQADTETLFTTPQTPYTRTLIQAALSP